MTALDGRLLAVMADDGLRRVRYGMGTTMAEPLLATNPNFKLLCSLSALDCSGSVASAVRVSRPLGYGAFSTVELCSLPASVSAPELPSVFALKRLDPRCAISGESALSAPSATRSRLTAPEPNSVPAFDGLSLLAEGALLKSLNHPHLLRCYGALGTSALLLEYAPGGSLADRVKKADYDQLQALQWLAQVAHGLAYLHEGLHNGAVVHRDLKPSNVLLGADGSAKIADLGLFRLFPSTREQPPAPVAAARAETRTRWGRSRTTPPQPAATVAPLRLTKRTGTVCYMAPELFKIEGAYSQAVDVFSFGILAWELLAQRRAYEELTCEPDEIGELVAARGLRPKVPPSWPAPMAQLVRDCWATHESDRPSASDIVRQLDALLAALEITQQPLLSTQAHAMAASADHARGIMRRVEPSGVTGRGAHIGEQELHVLPSGAGGFSEPGLPSSKHAAGQPSRSAKLQARKGRAELSACCIVS